MKTPRAACAWLAALLLLLTGCGTVSVTPQPVHLTLAASSSAAPLASDLATTIEAVYPTVTLSLLVEPNEAAAVQAVTTGRADVALLAGAVEPPAGWVLVPVAVDALAVVVHPSRALDDLSPSRVNDVFSGQVRTWADLGAGDGSIQIFTREQGAPSRVLFSATLLQRPLTPTALVLPDDQTLLAQVARDPAAIAVLPAALIRGQVRIVSLDGLGPEWLLRGWPGYPLILPIGLLTSAEPTAEVRLLQDFIQSTAGQQAIRQHYGLPLPTSSPSAAGG